MTWSYNISQSTTLDQMRFIIGDTDNQRQLLQDEEINAVMTRHTSNGVVDLAGSAVELAEHLEAYFVRRAESRSGDIIADFLTVAAKYAALAKRFRQKKTKGWSMIDPSTRHDDRGDTDLLTHPQIQVAEFDDPSIKDINY